MIITIRDIFGLNEHAFKFGNIEDKIFDEIGNIVTNWCLIRKAETDPAYSWNHHHWINELRNALDRCFRAMGNAKFSKKALDRRVHDVFYVDSKCNDPEWVFDNMYGKLVDDENIPEDEARELVAEWCSVGLPEIVDVLKNSRNTREYIAGKRDKAPYREPRR